MRIRVATAVVIGALTLAGNGWAAGATPTSLEELVVEMADSPAQHAALANYYRSKAAAARAEAQRHEHMGHSYNAGKMTDKRHPEVSMHTLSFAKYVDCLDRDDQQGVADLMLESARKLAAIGADFLICPDNTIHQAFRLVEPNSPRQWLLIAAVVAEEAVSRGFRRVGLTGTRWLVNSPVYPEQLAARGLEFVRPSDTDRHEIHRIIMEEGRRHLSAGLCCVLSVGHRGPRRSWLRFSRARLHGDSAHHQRHQLRVADAGFHAPPRTRGPSARNRAGITLTWPWD